MQSVHVARRILAALLLLSIIFSAFSATAAESEKIAVVGKVFEYGEDWKYEFSSARESKKTDQAETYGSFFITGDVIAKGKKDGIPAFTVVNGGLNLFYTYTDKLLNAGEDEWHLTEDKNKIIDSYDLDNKIGKGTILVQTSRDRKNWNTIKCSTNVFESSPKCDDAFCGSQDIQLINGCYYRMIVAYELKKRTKESSFLFWDTSDYEYKKVAEVYEFYAGSSSAETSYDPEQTHQLGVTVRTETFDGYDGQQVIDKDDLHYNITIGQFFVSGYTDKVANKDGTMVFLKNVGDKVTLWFKLKENINAIGGNKKVTVSADHKGYDRYFQTPTIDFGRGTLIVRYTDYNNNSTDPQIYTNYLEANTYLGADTKVSLFEEGDYEIALDYELTEDRLIDKIAHYRIFFKFSIRNGNCMVYPFDLKTGAELTNSAMTENGFRLDLAKSRYLKIAVKREMMAESADGLVEDTRFNGPAKDGAEYREDGIYTITVSNQYTGQLTTKKIYVGTNLILKAYMTTGLSIPEINALVAGGATIAEDGTITLAEMSTVEVSETESSEVESMEISEKEEPSQESPGQTEKNPKEFPHLLVIGIAAAVLACAAAGIFAARKSKNKKNVD